MLPVWVFLVYDNRKHNWVVQAVNSFHTAEKERRLVGRPLPTKRESRSSWVTPGHQRLLSIPGHQRLLSIPGHQRLLSIPGHRHLPCIPGHQRPLVYTRSSIILRLYQVISNFLIYTRSSTIPCLYQGEASYSHQWPRCGERFLGR